MCMVRIWHRKRAHETPRRFQITPEENAPPQSKTRYPWTSCETRTNENKMRQSPVTRSRQRKEATGATSARNRARAESRLGSRTPAVEHTKRSSPFGAVYSQIHARARHICVGLRTAPRLLPFRSLSPFRPFRSDILYHPVLLCSWLFIFTYPLYFHFSFSLSPQ